MGATLHIATHGNGVREDHKQSPSFENPGKYGRAGPGLSAQSEPVDRFPPPETVARVQGGPRKPATETAIVGRPETA
jgi:hypothetical protein